MRTPLDRVPEIVSTRHSTTTYNRHFVSFHSSWNTKNTIWISIFSVFTLGEKSGKLCSYSVFHFSRGTKNGINGTRLSAATDGDCDNNGTMRTDRTRRRRLTAEHRQSATASVQVARLLKHRSTSTCSPRQTSNSRPTLLNRAPSAAVCQ